MGLGAGVCERELGVVVDRGGPLNQADFAGSSAGIFGAVVVMFWRPEGLLEHMIFTKKNKYRAKSKL